MSWSGTRRRRRFWKIRARGVAFGTNSLFLERGIGNDERGACALVSKLPSEESSAREQSASVAKVANFERSFPLRLLERSTFMERKLGGAKQTREKYAHSEGREGDESMLQSEL